MRKKMIGILRFALSQRDTVQVKDFAILAVAFLCMFRKIGHMPAVAAGSDHTATRPGLEESEQSDDDGDDGQAQPKRPPNRMKKNERSPETKALQVSDGTPS